MFAAGEQARVPLLVGWNSQEADWRRLLTAGEPAPERYQAELRTRFGEHADEVLRFFPGATPEQVVESGTALAGATFIAYSTWKWAELQEATGKAHVYRYFYVHPRPATRAPAQTPPPPGAVDPESALRAARIMPPSNDAAPSGAVHSAEIEYALGNLATNDVYAWSAADSAVSTAMEGYFANFVKRGSPDGPGLPRWPAATPGDSTRVMILDVRPHAEPAGGEAAYRLLDRFYTTPPRH